MVRAERTPSEVGALASTQIRSPRLDCVKRPPRTARETRDVAPPSPRASKRAASVAADCSRSCRPTTCNPLNATTRTITTAGSTTANSAVTLPRSPQIRSTRKRESTMDHLGEHAAHLVTSQDHDEQPSEPDGCHCGNRVLRCCGAFVSTEPPRRDPVPREPCLSHWSPFRNDLRGTSASSVAERDLQGFSAGSSLDSTAYVATVQEWRGPSCQHRG
jgi:hypothetical protein